MFYTLSSIYGPPKLKTHPSSRTHDFCAMHSYCACLCTFPCGKPPRQRRWRRSPWVKMGSGSRDMKDSGFTVPAAETKCCKGFRAWGFLLSLLCVAFEVHAGRQLIWALGPSMLRYRPLYVFMIPHHSSMKQPYHHDVWSSLDCPLNRFHPHDMLQKSSTYSQLLMQPHGRQLLGMSRKFQDYGKS